MRFMLFLKGWHVAKLLLNEHKTYNEIEEHHKSKYRDHKQDQ